MKFVLVCITMLVSGGCFDSTVEPEMAKLGEVFVVDYEQTVEIGDALIVSYTSFEESRCPEGTQCIRAGELFATLILKDKRSESQVSATFCVAGECLSSNSASEKIIYYSGGEIRVGEFTYIVEVQNFTPQKSTQAMQADLYKLSLLIKKQ